MLYFAKILIILLQIIQNSWAKSCHNELKLNWTVSISNSAVVSSPLLTKLNKNDKNCLIVTTLDGSLSVIDLDSGQESPEWPVHFPEESFYSGPLLYDINQDGSLDILLTTADGKIMFVSQDGTLLTGFTIPLPKLMIKRNWYIVNIHRSKDSKYDLSPEKNTQFRSTDKHINYQNYHKSFILLDTHILSNPVIGDFSGDGIYSDLIIPVNYYFDNDIKLDQQRLGNLGLGASEIDFYQANGLVVVDLRTRGIIYNTTFELTLKSSSLPSYLLSSPVVINLDSHRGEEVLLGSMSGKIHIWNQNGQYPWSFDLSDSIAGQISTGDITNDGRLEIIAVDASANVMCYNNDTLLWDAIVSGTVSAGPQLYDIDNDGQQEVVIATNDGYIWALNGQTGKVLPNWPVSLGGTVHSQILFRIQPDNLVNLYVISGGNLNILSGSSQCVVVPTDEISYTPVIYDAEHLAFIVSTIDGTILSFSQLGLTNTSTVQDKSGIAFTSTTNKLHTITTANFNLEFAIYITLKHFKPRVVITYLTEKGVTHLIRNYSKPGVYSLTLVSPKIPMHTYIQIELFDRFKQCSNDRIFVSFHPGTKRMLVLYAVLPLLVMVVLLLLLHGYPEGDLLPQWSDN